MEALMILVLRLLHILSGAFWYGSVIFTARFLMPSLRAAGGPVAGAVMAQLNQRRISMVMISTAIVNVVSGIWLMYVVSAGDMGTWMRSHMGRTFAFGGAMGILAVLVGMIMNPPIVKRLGQISEAAAKRGGPPTPEEGAEIARLQKRMGIGMVLTALLLTLAIGAMAIARYV
jgi:uncharacterized membrane protein